MKIKYIKEGYFKDINKIKADADKKVSVRDSYGKMQIKYKIDEIRFALFTYLYLQYQKDRAIYTDYTTYIGSNPLETDYMIPNLRDEIAPPLQDDITEEEWTLEYHKYFSDGTISPIKSIDYIDGNYIATIRLVRNERFFSTYFYPGKFLEGFTKIEKTISDQCQVNFKIKFVLLEDTVKSFARVNDYEKRAEETSFPGHNVFNISLYNFDKESLKYLEDFINRFDDICDEYNSLTLVSLDIDSLSDIPSFKSKFRTIRFDTTRSWKESSKFYNLKELGDFKKLMKGETHPAIRRNGNHSIIIFPYSFKPEDVERLSNGVIPAKKCLDYSDYRAPVSFNPFTWEDTSPSSRSQY